MFAMNTLGTRAVKSVAYCHLPANAKSDYCSSVDVKRLTKLVDSTSMMLAQTKANLFQARYSPVIMAPQSVSTEAFLNGDNGWYRVSCKTNVAAESPKSTIRHGWRVAGTYTDLGLGDYSESGFANFSAVNDRGGDRTVDSKLAIGYRTSAPDDPNVTGIGYASYVKSTSRKNGEEENDVALGYLRQDAVRNFSLDISAHTDDRGESQLYRLAANRTTQFEEHWFSPCNQAGKVTLICTYDFNADYVGVGHTGSRNALKDIKEYGRLGLDLAYVVSIPMDESATVSLSAQYQKRFDFLKDADAELQQYAITLVPDKKAHFSFSLSYSYGKALIDLTPVKKTILSLGYRR
jgi:hypothetical protein